MSIQTATREDVIALCEQVRGEFPIIGGGLVDKHLADDETAWAMAEKALGYVQAKHPEGLDGVVEAFATVSMDFLRLQARFMQTRRYSSTDSSHLVDDLYSDDSKMSGYYLDGLATTYALWPNHARMINFLQRDFISKLRPGARVLEVGVGHGLMAALLFESVPDLTYVGVDISPSSLAYSAAALANLGISPDRVQMLTVDAMRDDLRMLAAGHGFDGLICCEVLEHVDAPELLLSNLSNSLRDGGHAFFSTVANLEAEDHVYLYENVEQIRAMLGESGWTIVADQPLTLPGADDWDPLPVNYSGICVPTVGV